MPGPYRLQKKIMEKVIWKKDNTEPHISGAGILCTYIEKAL